MLRYAFRLHRWGMVGFGIVCALSSFFQATFFSSEAGTTAASRAQFAQTMTALAAQLSYLLPVPHHRLDTLAGYVQWRAWGTLSIVVTVWAIAAAAGAVRGDEDKHLVDSWLAARVSRARLVGIRFVAFAAAALVASAAGGLATLIGAARTESIGLDRLAGQAFALWLFTLTCFALLYLIAQFPASRRGAQGAGAALMLVLFLLNAAARSQHSLDAISWISPYRWYDATDVLAPDGHLDLIGVALSVAEILVAGGLAAFAFVSRDIRGPLIRAGERHARDVPPSPALSWPVARLLYRERWVVLAWAGATAAIGIFMVSIAHANVDNLLSLPGMRAFLTHGSSDPYRGFISVVWFGIAQLVLAGFAIHLVSGWASDDTEGMLEMVLSKPEHRVGVIVERATMAVVAIAIAVAVGSLATSAAAAASGVSLDAAGVFRASWLLIPLALTFAAAGAAASAWWPRAAVGVLGMLAFLSYIANEIAPLMSWPTWVADLSVFQLYGMPYSAGISWTGLWAMLGIVVVGFGLATLLMQRREVGR